MSVNLSPVGGVAAQFFDNNGNPLSGGTLQSYAAGTTTPLATYTAANGNIAHSNPIQLDAGGRIPAGGEVWLTDGLEYKFVLKDATGVLIATYDNITGINSNFVNYTNQQEIQTATAGQTVFTLTTMQYLPSTGSLSVFVDGVNQYGPGAQYAFLETDATTVTFVTGLHVGASVKFTTSQLSSAAATDAEQVSYVPPFTGSAATNVEAKLSEYVSVKDFGAVGDGVVNDRAAIQSAFDSGAKQIYFPTGTYYLGTTSSAINFIDLSSLGSGISIFTEGFVEFVVETTSTVQPNIFYLVNNSHFYCGPVRFRDTGYNPNVNWQGATGFCLDNPSGGNWGNITIDAIYGRTLVACVKVVGAAESANRIRGIHIKQLYSDDCYYGFSCQDQGDAIKIDNLIAYQNHRPYFVYGVTGHQVKIFNRNNRNASGAINICRQVSGLPTSSIWVDYAARDMAVNVNHVLINHIDLLGGVISDIHVNVDIQSSTAYTPVRFVNYTGSGGVETNAPSTNIVRDVFISGSCDANAATVSCYASYLNKNQRLTFNQGYYLICDSSVLAAFQLDQLARSQTPTWTASTVNPSIGNGTLTYNIDIVGGLATVTLKMIAGSTTTFGTGDWTFGGFQFYATGDAVGSWLAKIGSDYFSGTTRILSGSAEIQGFGYNNPNTLYSTFPGVWSSGDTLTMTVTYPIS